MKLTPLTARPAAGALGRTRNRRESFLLGTRRGSISKRRPGSPGYEPGTGATLANAPFSGLDDRVPSPRARGRGVFDPEDERVDVRHNGRHIIRCPTGARDLPRVIAALDESGARPIRRLAAV